MLKIGMLISRSKRLMVSIERTSRPPSKYATGNFQVLEISMAVTLAFPMEISMAHGKFHGPCKFPWAALFHLGRAVWRLVTFLTLIFDPHF